MDFARSAFGVRCVFAPLLGSKVERSPRRLLNVLVSMDAAFAAWLSMRTMIWDFYLRLRRLTLSSELRKRSRAGSRSTFLQHYTEPGSATSVTTDDLSPITNHHFFLPRRRGARTWGWARS